MSPDIHVRLTNLTRSFHEGDALHAVLQAVDATIVRGETVALRGRSGSGKSTLLNLISGIDAPDQGEVEIDGQVISKIFSEVIFKIISLRINICVKFIYIFSNSIRGKRSANFVLNFWKSPTIPIS